MSTYEDFVIRSIQFYRQQAIQNRAYAMQPTTPKDLKEQALRDAEACARKALEYEEKLTPEKGD